MASASSSVDRSSSPSLSQQEKEGASASASSLSLSDRPSDGDGSGGVEEVMTGRALRREARAVGVAHFHRLCDQCLAPAAHSALFAALQQFAQSR
jgi:hypothetical protein